MPKKLIIWLVLAAVVLVGLYLILGSPESAGPSDKTTAPSPSAVAPSGSKTAPTSGGLVQVDIKGFAFVGQTVRVVPGTKIVWKNSDDAVHSVVGAGFQSKPLAKGETFSYTFTKEGTYPYYCGFHAASMRGEIVVRGGNF